MSAASMVTGGPSLLPLSSLEDKEDAATAAAAIARSSRWLAALAQQAPTCVFAAASALAGRSLSTSLAIAALKCRLLSGHAGAASQGLKMATAKAAKTWGQSKA